MKLLTIDRFEQNYVPEPMSGCWLWLNSTSKTGHGSFRMNGKRPSAHSASYQLHKGTVPKGLCVRHRCDIPSCVNPDHLELGTWADNNRDRATRGGHVDHWKGSCKKGHDLDTHGYHRPNGTRFCASCNGLSPRGKNGEWL